MANNKPVTIWIPKHKAKRDPKFHINLKFAGAGRSTKAELIGVKS